MTTSPQAVTERYVSNLIHNGRNKEFDIDSVTMQEHVIDSINVGYYFSVRVLSKSGNELAFGPTLAAAVRNALIKHGVTFR